MLLQVVLWAHLEKYCCSWFSDDSCLCKDLLLFIRHSFYSFLPLLSSPSDPFHPFLSLPSWGYPPSNGYKMYFLWVILYSISWMLVHSEGVLWNIQVLYLESNFIHSLYPFLAYSTLGTKRTVQEGKKKKKDTIYIVLKRD